MKFTQPPLGRATEERWARALGATRSSQTERTAGGRWRSRPFRGSAPGAPGASRLSLWGLDAGGCGFEMHPRAVVLEGSLRPGLSTPQLFQC